MNHTGGVDGGVYGACIQEEDYVLSHLAPRVPARCVIVAVSAACICIGCDSGPTDVADARCRLPTGNLTSYSLGSGPPGTDVELSVVVASGVEGNWDDEVGILDLGPEDVEMDLAQLILWFNDPYLDDTASFGLNCRSELSFGQYSTTDVAVGTSEELNAKYYETWVDPPEGSLMWAPVDGTPDRIGFLVAVRQVTDPVIGLPDGPAIQLGGTVNFR